MFDKFKNNKNLRYFFLYTVTFMIQALLIAALGPFIPYLAAQTNTAETQYSFLFSCRSFGMVAGCFLIKYLQKQVLTNHNIILLGCSFICIFSFLFSQTRVTLWLGVWMFIGAVSYGILEVMINVCIYLTHKASEISFWMQLINSLYGIGGLLGPSLVYVFEGSSYISFGVFVALLIPFYYSLQSPEHLQKDQPQIQLHNQNTNQSKKISKSLEYCICLFLFLFLGLECTVGGWISSYAVLMGVTDNKGATVFAGLFWTLKATFLLMLTFAPGNASQKLKILILSMTGSGIIALLIVYAGFPLIACYIGSILYGASASSMYPLILSFAVEEGLKIEDHQTANIIIAGVLSEGVLTTLVGVLIDWIHPNMFFYSLIAFSGMMWLVCQYCFHLIHGQKAQSQIEERQFQLKQGKGND